MLLEYLLTGEESDNKYKGKTEQVNHGVENMWYPSALGAPREHWILSKCMLACPQLGFCITKI